MRVLGASDKVVPVWVCLILLLSLVGLRAAADQQWDVIPANGVVDGGSGVWDVTTPNWTANGGGTDGVWTSGNAIFGTSPTSPRNVNIVSTGVDATAVTFNAAYNLSGGTLNLIGSNPTINGSSTISSRITSAATVTLNSGSLSLLGTVSTGLSGTTSLIVNGAAVSLASSQPAGSLGDMVINSGSLALSGSSLVGLGDITVNAGGTLLLNGANPAMGAGKTIRLNGSSLSVSSAAQLGSYNIFLGTNGTLNTAGTFTTTSNITLGTDNITFAAAAGTQTLAGAVTATLSGSVNILNKTGSGTLVLGGGATDTTPNSFNPQSLLYLQDQVWREMRREQGGISRWTAWARRRFQLRKEKS